MTPIPLRPRRAYAAWTILLATVGLAAMAPGAEAARHPARSVTGRIEGTVEISTVLTTRRPQFRPYAEPGAGSLPPAPPRDPIAAELRNVVVYLDADSTRLPGSAAQLESHRHASIAQRDERFAPHVVAVMQGGTVDFPNDDDVFHNVFSLSTAAGPRGFDLGRYPRGSSRSATFTRVGTVQVFCHIHTDMSALVLVLANPFFTSPGEDHRFALEEVPEGDYTIVGWHERIKQPITRHIHVTAGQTTPVDFNIPLLQGGAAAR